MVVFPLRRSSATRGEIDRTCYVIVAAIWVLASVVMVPIAGAHSVELRFHSDGKTSKICNDSWSDPVLEKYFWVFLFVCYGLVVIQMIALYCAIGKVLYSRRVPGDGSSSNSRLVHLRSRTKTVKMLCVVVALFVVLWMPYFVLKVLKVLQSHENGTIPHQAFAAASMLGIFNSLCNFVVYAAMHQFFRDGVKELFRCDVRRRKVHPVIILQT